MIQIIGLIIVVIGIGRLLQETMRTVAETCKSPWWRESWTSLSVLVAGIAVILLGILTLMLLASGGK